MTALRYLQTYLFNVLVALDNTANALLMPLMNLFVEEGGYKFGNADETLSSVFGKNVKLGKCKLCRWICKILHLFDENHCERSIEIDP